jgi:hypothetical protein
MNKGLGKIGYILREMINNYRFYLLNLHDRLFKIIDWLDKKPGISYWRKKDRGI